MATKQHSTPLKTQKDGRLFAIKFLTRLERIADPDLYNATRSYRSGPQSAKIRECFDEIYGRGTREAQIGFFVVMADYLSNVATGFIPYAKEYPQRERNGALEHWVPAACKGGGSTQSARAV